MRHRNRIGEVIRVRVEIARAQRTQLKARRAECRHRNVSKRVVHEKPSSGSEQRSLYAGDSLERGPNLRKDDIAHWANMLFQVESIIDGAIAGDLPVETPARHISCQRAKP